MTTQPEVAVLQAAAELVEDFGNHRVAEYFARFDPASTFTFYTAPERIESRAAYEALWQSWEAENGFHVRGCTSLEPRVRMLSETVALFTHDVDSLIEMAGSIDTVRESETIVFRLIGGTWLAVHEHLSSRSG